MATPFKYMFDENEQKSSVLIPIKTWAKIDEDFNKLQNKLNFIIGLKGGVSRNRID